MENWSQTSFGDPAGRDAAAMDMPQPGTVAQAMRAAFPEPAK